MPDEDGDWHDFEPEQVCQNCGSDEANCQCDYDDQDLADDDDTCVICGMASDDPAHQEDDDE